MNRASVEKGRYIISYHDHRNKKELKSGELPNAPVYRDRKQTQTLTNQNTNIERMYENEQVRIQRNQPYCRDF